MPTKARYFSIHIPIAPNMLEGVADIVIDVVFEVVIEVVIEFVIEVAIAAC